MISYLINSFLIGVLFVDMVERRFPNEFKNIVIQISMNLIFIYSKCQIYLMQINKNINLLIEKNPTLLKIKNEFDNIMKCKKMNVVMTQFFKNGELCNIIEEQENVFDFAIYSWFDVNSNCINKKIIYDINEVVTLPECSDIKFMLVEIKIGENKPHKIDLKTDNYNYYIVGNKFTKQFFIYYLINHLNIDKSELNDAKLSIKLIDHNVNSFQLDFTDKNESIIVRKNDYIAELNNNDN